MVLIRGVLDGRRMQARSETVGERGDRGRRSQNLNLDASWSLSRRSPSVEREELHMVARDQVGLVGRWINDDCSDRKGIDTTGPENPVLSPDESTAAAVSLGGNPLVELRRQDGTAIGLCQGHRTSIGEVVGSAAESTRSMTGRQGNSIVEEEQRSPGLWSFERMLPIPVLDVTCDPQRPSVMTGQLSGIIYQTATVAGEDPT